MIKGSMASIELILMILNTHLLFHRCFFYCSFECVVVIYWFYDLEARSNLWNRIGGVMVGVLASRAVDRGFDPRSGQPNNKIGMCCFSAKRPALRRNTSWLGIRIMCLSGATCLAMDCCFSELALQKSNKACWSSTKRILSSSHLKLTCSRHDMAKLLPSWR